MEEDTLFRGKHAFTLNLNQTKQIKRLHTCDDSGVVLSTGNMLDAAVPKVLQWFWQIDLEQKCSVAQLAKLTPSKCIHTLLCKQQ